MTLTVEFIEYKGYPMTDYHINCDFCSFLDIGRGEDKEQVFENMKMEGWRFVHLDGEIRHKCPICVNSELNFKGPIFEPLKIKREELCEL